MHDILLNHLPFANHLAGGHQGIRAWASLAGGATGRPVALVAPALSSSVRQAMVSTFKAAGDGWQIISGRSNDRLHLCATCCRTLWATSPSLAACLLPNIPHGRPSVASTVASGAGCCSPLQKGPHASPSGPPFTLAGLTGTTGTFASLEAHRCASFYVF
jgi:hypothetical protein